MALELNELLELRGFGPEGAKLVRHHNADTKCVRTPFVMWRSDFQMFQRYQALQRRQKFAGASFLISFVKTPTNDTLFVGIYKVNGCKKSQVDIIDPATDLPCKEHYLYNLSLTDYAEDWIGKLTINWGKNRAWVQDAETCYKDVIEIRRNYDEHPFPGYFLFRCRLSDLTLLPTKWAEYLKAAQGVYVLTSLSSGQHYVGSAAGRGGFLERWQRHHAVGGAAVGLQAHGAFDYQVAILQVASGFDSLRDIVRAEHRWMDKLQSRGMGLNGQPHEGSSEAPQDIT